MQFLSLRSSSVDVLRMKEQKDHSSVTLLSQVLRASCWVNSSCSWLDSLFFGHPFTCSSVRSNRHSHRAFSFGGSRESNPEAGRSCRFSASLSAWALPHGGVAGPGPGLLPLWLPHRRKHCFLCPTHRRALLTCPSLTLIRPSVPFPVAISSAAQTATLLSLKKKATLRL